MCLKEGIKRNIPMLLEEVVNVSNDSFRQLNSSTSLSKAY